MRDVENLIGQSAREQRPRDERNPSQTLPDLSERRPLEDEIGDVDCRIADIGDKRKEPDD